MLASIVGPHNFHPAITAMLHEKSYGISPGQTAFSSHDGYGRIRDYKWPVRR